MNTWMTRRKLGYRWLAALGLALALLPAFSSDASAQYRRGGFYGRGYGGGPRVYSRGYAGAYGPRYYNRGYGGYAPRPYNNYGFYSYGVPYRGAYAAPFVAPGYRYGGGVRYPY